MRIYLTSAGAVSATRRNVAKPETRATVGPATGLALSIMRWPDASRAEAGYGRVLTLTPPAALLEAALAAKAAGGEQAEEGWRTYEAALRALWTRPTHAALLRPGVLAFGRTAADIHAADAHRWDGGVWIRVGEVPDGATLICSCGRDAAAAGRCHRVLAAELLQLAGWEVVLEGRTLATTEAGEGRQETDR